MGFMYDREHTVHSIPTPDSSNGQLKRDGKGTLGSGSNGYTMEGLMGLEVDANV